MTDENLGEFLSERVLPTREIHHVQYPLDMDVPATGVMIDCPSDSMAAVILPTFVRDVLHLEVHFWVDGQRVQPQVTVHQGQVGLAELTLRRPNTQSKLILQIANPSD